MDAPTAFVSRHFSTWRKAIVKVDDGVGDRWFSSKVARKIGNEVRTSFWNVAWREGLPFRVKYHRLFTISIQQEASAREMGVNGEWVFMWRRRLFQWEEQLFVLLKYELDCFVWSPKEEDMRH